MAWVEADLWNAPSGGDYGGGQPLQSVERFLIEPRLPSAGIGGNVAPDAIQLIVVSNDVVVEVSLPEFPIVRLPA